MVFGRGRKELAHLRARGIPVDVIPGINSAVGVPTSIGLPVTYRVIAPGFAVVAGETLNTADAVRYASVDTLVILMGARHRKRNASNLIDSGRPHSDPVALIESGTTPNQRVTITELGDIASGWVEVRAPIVWICGPVVTTLRALTPWEVCP